MILSFHGRCCVYIQGKTANLLFDSINEVATDLAPDIILKTVNSGAPEENFDKLSRRVIDGPGEYEIKSINIKGFASLPGTAYLLQMEDMTIAHFGFLADIKFPEDILAEFSGIDIILVPVGGGDGLSAKDAIRLVNMIDPRVIIPINFQSKKFQNLDGPEAFFKELGKEIPPVRDRLSVKSKNIPQEGREVFLLKA